MNLTLAGILSGVGQAGTALANQRKEAEDKALRQQQIDYQGRQVALAEREQERALSDREALVQAAAAHPELAEFKDLMRSPDGRKLAEFVLSRKQKAAEKAEEAQRGVDLGRVLREQAITPPQPTGALMPGEDEEAASFIGATPRIVDKDLAALANIVPYLRPEGREKVIAERFKPREPKDAGFSLGPGHQRFDAAGRPIASVPATPKEANLGERREALIDTVLTQKGYVPGTAEFNEQKLNLTRTFPLTEGGMVFGGSQLIPPAGGPRAAAPGTPGQPGGPAPLAQGPQKPIEAAAAQLVVGAATARKASQAVLAALKDPAVRDYIGPYGQYISTVQGKAPFEALGKIPPPVVALEQNIARVKNYTIKLITGAQMSEPEAKRIMGELPDLGQQPDVLAQRMVATDANNALMEGMVRDLVMRGNPQAAAVAKELGLDVSTKLGGPAGVGNTTAPTQAPQQFAAPPPPAQFPGRILTNPATGQRMKSDGQRWVPVP